MLKIKNVVLPVIIALFISACSGGAPSGTDSDVKDLVIEITTDELRKQLVPVIYQKVTNVPVGLVGMKVTYDGLLEKRNEDKNSEIISAIDDIMNEASISLKNIRVDSVNDEIKKSESSADIVINGKTSPITYTAQENSEGEIYVEVFGL